MVFYSQSTINSVHIVAYSGVFVNDLQMFYEKITNTDKNRCKGTDRFCKATIDRSKIYVQFSKNMSNSYSSLIPSGAI